MDAEIATLIKEQNYKLWDIDTGNVQFNDIYDRTLKLYMESNKKCFTPLMADIRTDASPKIVYTPLHGVGMEVVERTISTIGLHQLVPVPSQKDPDPSFRTVKFPNPEEGTETLDEAIKLATKLDCNLIFANDPDADRFNCCERGLTGEWKIFNGNEIAIIFANYLWHSRKTLYPSAKEFVMLNSCVSSKLVKAMGLKEGFRVEETLTGFKYLGNAGKKLEAEGCKVLMAYEEAIGFMVNTGVWDKDGISALILMYLLTMNVYNQGKTLSTHLIDLYHKYGYFVQYNSYYFCDPHKITSIFNTIRVKLHERIPGSCYLDLSGSCQIPLSSEYAIMAIKDYPGTNMITLYFDSTCLSWVTLRASGTEPKIKFYSEISSKYHERVESMEKLVILLNSLCQWLLEPDLNDLQKQGNK